MISEKKYLGVDYGTKRVGLAVGSIYPKMAGMLDGSLGRNYIVEEIVKKAKELEVEGIVLGLPLYPSGDESDLSKEVKIIGGLLASETKLPVYYEPEGYTSVEAEKSFAADQKWQPKKGEKDQVAAAIILEQFFAHGDK